jgi:predicted O-linked N-acetylglucosamine transferase (SPINDLY family)
VGALAAGLPVLTRPGEWMLARMGASLVTSAGLPELACAVTGAYEERAVELATQPGALAELRARLAGGRRSAPLFDLPAFARQLEAAYRAIWRHAREGSADRRIRAI